MKFLSLEVVTSVILIVFWLGIGAFIIYVLFIQPWLGGHDSGYGNKNNRDIIDLSGIGKKEKSK